MHYGPCGGVREDGSCEMRPQPCPFATLDAAPPWAGSPAPLRPAPELRQPGRPHRPDLAAYDPPAVRRDRRGARGDVRRRARRRAPEPARPAADADGGAEVKAAGGAAVDHVDLPRPQPRRAGAGAAGLAALGGVGVFCVTGDGRAPGVRAEVTQVFDIDGTRLGRAWPRTTGSRSACPRRRTRRRGTCGPAACWRSRRRGRRWCVLNHVAPVERWPRSWPRRARSGCELPFVAGVAVYTDERSARGVAGLPRAAPRRAPRVARVLAAPDPVAAGIAEAVAEARALLAVAGRGRGQPVRARVRAGRARPGRRSRPPSRRRSRAQACARPEWEQPRGDGTGHPARRPRPRRFRYGRAGDRVRPAGEVTEEAVGKLGPEYAIPAGCRGSGSPADLAWLARRRRSARTPGSSTSGPASVVRPHGSPSTSARPPSASSPCAVPPGRGRRLFGCRRWWPTPGRCRCGPGRSTSCSASACGARCPRRTGPGGWRSCAGCCVPGGDLGLLVFVARGPLPGPLPEGNDFPTEDALRALLEGAGLTVVQSRESDGLAEAPKAWRERADAIDAALERRHGEDPRWRRAQEQTARIARLIGGGHVRPLLVHARAA